MRTNAVYTCAAPPQPACDMYRFLTWLMKNGILFGFRRNRIKGVGKGAGRGTLGKVDRKTIVCFKMRNTDNCFDGDKCEESHKKDIIDVSKEKNKNGQGKSKNKKGGTGKDKAKLICRDFNSPDKKCLRCSYFDFLNEQSAMTADLVASLLASTVARQRLS